MKTYLLEGIGVWLHSTVFSALILEAASCKIYGSFVNVPWRSMLAGVVGFCSPFHHNLLMYEEVPLFP